MSQVCPRCKAPIQGRTVRCAECGTIIQTTAEPATVRAVAEPPAPRAPEAPAPPAPLFVDQPLAEPVLPPEPGKRAVVPPPRPAPAPPPPRSVLTAPADEAPVEAVTAVAPLPVADTLAAQGLFEGPGDIQGWMARMLAGAGDELPPLAQPEDEAGMPADAPYLPPPDPPLIFYPALPEPDEGWSDASFPPRPSTLTLAQVGASGALGLLSEELRDEEARTCEAVALLDEPPAPTVRLEFLDQFGEWVDGGPVPGEGCILGRDGVPDELPGAESLATDHLALRYEGETLVVEDLGSIDGVYRRLASPAVLDDGQRFRIGGFLLEFRRAEALLPVAELATADGGALTARDLEPLGYVDIIRPDGQPGVRFPLTKRDSTVIGREGPNACIALVGDRSVSTSHAQICVRNDEFILEDLKSRGGTLVRLDGPTSVQVGDVLQAGKLVFRVAEA